LGAVFTGIFTIVGVVVTAAAALLAAWIKYKTDRRQELRKERRELCPFRGPRLERVTQHAAMGA
jgi:hypothetical protein